MSDTGTVIRWVAIYSVGAASIFMSIDAAYVLIPEHRPYAGLAAAGLVAIINTIIQSVVRPS